MKYECPDRYGSLGMSPYLLTTDLKYSRSGRLLCFSVQSFSLDFSVHIMQLTKKKQSNCAIQQSFRFISFCFVSYSFARWLHQFSFMLIASQTLIHSKL